METFTVVNDDVLETAIVAAKTRLVFVAPGITLGIAEALGRRFRDIGRVSVTVILDADPEVCRLGYGELEGLKRIKQLADENLLELRHQPGVRIGILMSDQQTFIYAPTPLLIEAGSTQSEKPNAIVIRDTPLKQVEKAMAVTDDCLPANAEIGKKVVATGQIVSVEKDLKENPPKEFNIARAERVFNSRIQYVELKVENYKLSTRMAPIPPDLMGLSDNVDLMDRWRNNFRMFEGGKSFSVKVPELDENNRPLIGSDGSTRMIEYSEKALETERAQIAKDFLFVVRNFDTVILRARRPEFDKRIERFNVRLTNFSKAAQEKLESEMKRSIQNLVDYLAARKEVKSLPRYRKASFGKDVDVEELKVLLSEDLKRAFGSVTGTFNPNLTVRFKDITYESIHDPKFRSALSAVMPAQTVAKLFIEYDAAPGRAK